MCFREALREVSGCTNILSFQFEGRHKNAVTILHTLLLLLHFLSLLLILLNYLLYRRFWEWSHTARTNTMCLSTHLCLVLLRFLRIAPTSLWTTTHLHFTFLPVNLRIMFAQPRKTQNHVFRT